MKRKATAVLLMICMLFSLGVSYQPGPVLAAPNDDTKGLLDDLFGTGDDKAESTDDQSGPGSDSKENENALEKKVIEDYYSQQLLKWNNEKFESQSYQTVIHPRQIKSGSGPVEVTPASASLGYDEEVFLWNEKTPEINFTVNVPADGLYEIQIDYYALPGKITPPERGIQVGGEFPYYEARRIVFPRMWKNESDQFQRDQLGNDVYANQVEISQWQSARMMDASYLHDEPLKFRLKKGDNQIKLIYIREAMQVGRITVQTPERLDSYEAYLKRSGDEKSDPKVIQAYEAEKPFVKSDSYIQAIASGDINVTPKNGTLITLNTIGADSWKQGGQSVTWKIKAEQTGYYQIAFKYTQYFKTNMPVFRKVMLDGEVPFQEVASYPFQYSPDWKNEVLSDSEGKPFQFYLTEGEHQLTLIANPSPYQRVIQTVRETMDELGALNLEIKMATGNTQDVNRDWNITEQMPDITERLSGIAGKLRDEYDYLSKLSGESPDEARNLVIGAQQLERLASDPASIPYRFKRISEGSGSVNQKLGDLLLTLPQQQLQIDKFYVYANEELPKAKAGWWKKLVSMNKSFFTSFTKDYSQINPADEDSLQIWVNRPRQYVMLMQQLADQEFTAQTGIKVSLALMPNEQKLILANASGESPDVALGVSEKLPYELALRGALTDFSQYPDYKEVLGRFSPGAMLPFMFDGGVYALPETQNFWVLYYRKDILDALDLKVPETWDDVIGILPSLQRYGMNFYVPIADSSALKSFGLTAPFIYQQGGELFASDGTRTAVDSEQALEGFKLMTNIFTVYNMPLQVANFYNHFRDGNLPIGISNYNTYVELTTAAPELAGWWKIAPYPGVKNDKGEIVRWAPGTGQGVVSFKNSDKQQQSWEFIKWWTSADVQAKFGNLIETTYGPAYRWNSANLEAFSQLPWPEEDLNVILEQWKWLKDVAHIPGDYMLDRELSNSWNKVVFDGKNPRKTIEDAVILANREIMKKLEEFGYVKDGKVIKTLKVPTVEDVIKARGETK
ncbi:extracellular solute-binding protein [Paenibacillus spongiae]|uniref:Extracellular solute-binding protein n=1 Tax=Paenibacillus spongiae TaxID=2909671 RepID=A0ABY5S6G7_9BACL|nr:extracellular solute-binding protein [Paenibacillus spongiae]UVI29078.1 extracellular solute-binding protein [Paenibacillus spongiae]